MQNNEYIRFRANNYLKLDTRYAGGTEVVHYLEMLRDTVGFDNLKKAVKNPLKGRKIGAFYGCLLLRPSGVMAFDNAENPTIIEDFIKAIGATPVIFPCRNECCGGYVAMADKAAAQKQVERIMDCAVEHGVEELITACPLCMYNLDVNATEHKLPVHYFTELLAEALGVK
jgi:heterodisulfide reductase subunit B